MAIKLLKFGNHLLKSEKVLSRDIITGHVYNKVYTPGVDPSEHVLLQQFSVTENLPITTIETWNFQQNDVGMLILSVGAEGYLAKVTSVNSTHTSELVTVGEYTNVYHHTYTLDNVTLWANLSYLILINPNANWKWESELQTAFFGTEQDGTIIKASETWKMQAWLASNGQVRDAEIGTNISNIGGFSIEEVDNINQAFMMINGKNIVEF